MDISKRHVRVTGITPNRFVEFEFSIADRGLCVELMLPEAAFSEFCKANNVEFIGGGLSGNPELKYATGLLKVIK